MTVLLDIVHPAHVHFYKHLAWKLAAQGIKVTIAARKKDVTLSLLDDYGFEYVRIGESGAINRLAQGRELVLRDVALAKLARRTRARLILTRNPAGAQVGRLLGIPAVFDTDDGPAAGVHYYAAAPFAHVITTPDCMRRSLGPKHLKYPGYKQTAYLHPNHFKPNPEVLQRLGVEPGERFFIVRFVAMLASHDSGESGLPWQVRREVVTRLARHGKVFISSEAELPSELASQRFAPPAHLLHDALSYASLIVGDSQTMAAEASVLGTPSLRVSSWKGRLDYLEELETRYGLTESFRPSETHALLDRLDYFLAQPRTRALIADRHQRMLADKHDISEWYLNYVLSSLQG